MTRDAALLAGEGVIEDEADLDDQRAAFGGFFEPAEEFRAGR